MLTFCYLTIYNDKLILNIDNTIIKFDSTYKIEIYNNLWLKNLTF